MRRIEHQFQNEAEDLVSITVRVDEDGCRLGKVTLTIQRSGVVQGIEITPKEAKSLRLLLNETMEMRP